MAMGVLNKDEFLAELEKYSPKTPIASELRSPEIISPELGRGKGNKEVPESLRKLVGENAIQEGSKATQFLADALGISDSSLAAYKHGATSTTSYNSPNEALSKHIISAKEKITKKASRTLLSALRNITQDKLENSKAKDLAGVARDMSSVIRNMNPESDSKQNNFVIYAPLKNSEDSYKVIDVAE